jgi:hypothetical protein
MGCVKSKQSGNGSTDGQTQEDAAHKRQELLDKISAEWRDDVRAIVNRSFSDLPINTDLPRLAAKFKVYRDGHQIYPKKSEPPCATQKDRALAVSHALQVLLDNFDSRREAKRVGEVCRARRACARLRS